MDWVSGGTSNRYAVYVVALVTCLIQLVSCDGRGNDSSSHRIVVKQGGYSFVAPRGWRQFCCEDAPAEMQDEVHFARSQFGAEELFRIMPLPATHQQEFWKSLQERPTSKTVDGDYAYYEYKNESKEDRYVQFNRAINYKGRWFGIVYHTERLNVHIGNSLETSSLPPEIEQAIRSFRAIEQAEAAETSTGETETTEEEVEQEAVSDGEPAAQ